MTEHSSTPFTIKHQFNIFSSKGGLVAGCGGHQNSRHAEEADAKNTANAQFIAMACNTHDDLVEALENLLAAWRSQMALYKEMQYHMAQQYKCDNCGTLVIIDFPKNVTVITKEG